MKDKYQFTIFSPQNRAMKVPVTRNCPNGTSLFRVFLFNKINPIPIIAPIRKAKKSATRILGKPSKKPIKKASFISPTPIHLPREIKTIARKKPAAPRAAYIVLSISYLV